MLSMSKHELTKISKNANAPIFLSGFAESLLSDSYAGHTKTIELILDRLYGKPKQSTDLTSSDNQIQFTPMTIIVESDPARKGYTEKEFQKKLEEGELKL